MEGGCATTNGRCKKGFGCGWNASFGLVRHALLERLSSALQASADASPSRNAQFYQPALLAPLPEKRDNMRVRACLDALKRTAAGDGNTMPDILDAVRAYATLGEVCDALREVFGSYQETSLV